jgi:hypothetical protein
MTLNVDGGGVTGTIDAGTLGDATITGTTNVVKAETLSATFRGRNVTLLSLRATKNTPKLEMGSADLLVVTPRTANTLDSITADEINALIVVGSLRVNKSLDVLKIGNVFTGGDLTVGASGAGDINTNALKGLVTLGNLTVAGKLTSRGAIGLVYTGGWLKANIISPIGKIGPIMVGMSAASPAAGSLIGSVQSLNSTTGPITVFGNIMLPPGATTSYLVRAKQAMGSVVSLYGNIGTALPKPRGEVEKMEGASIDAIDALGLLGKGGNIFADQIVATNGNIKLVRAAQTISASVTAIGGNLLGEVGTTITGNIRAQTVVTPGNPNGQGGNIWYVYASKPLNGTIWADWDVGYVNLGANSNATVKAQQGGRFDPTTGAVTVQAVRVIVVGARGPFEGVVQFLFPSTVATPAIYYSGSPLLTLIDSTTPADGTTWTVEGNGEYTNVQATFIWNPNVLNRNPRAPLRAGLQKGAKFTVAGDLQTDWWIE